MKNALMLFLDDNSDKNAEFLSGAIRLFEQSDFSLFSVEILSKTDDLGLKRSIEKFKDTADNLIIATREDVALSVKNLISVIMDKPLKENSNAKNFVSAVSGVNGRAINEDFCLLPLEATLIPNPSGVVQGFMLDDEEFTLSYLSGEINEFGVMAKSYLFPYLVQKYALDYKKYTLKYFGDENALKTALEYAKVNYDCDFKYDLFSSYGDVRLELTFDNKKHNNKEEVVRYIVSTFQDEIYATQDVSLSERLFDALKLKKLKLSTAESFTAGNLISSIIKYSGASEIVDEGIVCYSNDSKTSRLGVKKESLTRCGAVSSVVAYEMALGLLVENKCDLAIATTGIAGPNSDNTDKPVGLCFIAIGMKDGIHTYKYNFNGNRETVTNLAKNTATYLAIKRIKKL